MRVVRDQRGTGVTLCAKDLQCRLEAVTRALGLGEEESDLPGPDGDGNTQDEEARIVHVLAGAEPLQRVARLDHRLEVDRHGLLK